MRYSHHSSNNGRDLASVFGSAAQQAMLGFAPDFGRNVLDSLASSNASYPPYNLIEINEHEYRIEIAAAGFSKDELSITVEKDLLTISGEKKRKMHDDEDEDSKIVFHHKGISKKSFARTFVLGKNTHVAGADFVDGILFVDVVHEIPPEDEPKRIEIGS